MTAARSTGDPHQALRFLTAGEMLWGGLALMLVAAYLNSVVAWQWIEASLSSAVTTFIPLLFALGLAAALTFGHWRRARMHPTRFALWVSVACVLAGAAWALTDPLFPAKRIHIFEYALLALVVRQFFRERLPDPMRTIAGVLVAGVLGLHDELLQGLHPGRFFAPTDIAVNALSAGAGGALAAAFRGDVGEIIFQRMKTRQWAVVAASFLGLAGFVFCLAALGATGANVAGLALPLVGLVFWVVLSRRDPIDQGGPRFVAIAAVLSAAAVAAPSISLLFDLPFA